MAIRRLLLGLFLAVVIGQARADNFNVLDGIQREQSMARLAPKLGGPSQTKTFDDGWIARIYTRADYYLVLQIDPSNPDGIANIQITGKSNPSLHGLGKLNLGDDVSAAIKAMGKPDRIEQATDGIDKKAVAGTSIYSYDGFSFEVSEGKVTSIKLDGPAHPHVEALPDVRRLVSQLRAGDTYAVAGWLSPKLTIGDAYAFDGPVLDAVQSDGKLRDALFGKGGVASLDPADGEGALRIFDAQGTTSHPPAGFVFKPRHGDIRELVFVEGAGRQWQLYEVNR